MLYGLEMAEKKRGRPKGSRNELPYDLKELMATRLTERAVSQLEAILEHPDTAPRDRLKAIEMILAYGHGKPQSNQLVGIEAGPNLKELMVRFMRPDEDMKTVREANMRVIDHVDPNNPKRDRH